MTSLSPEFLDVVSLELTSACNLDCPMCPRSLSAAADRPGALLPRRAFEHVLESSHRIAHVNLNGLSENLLHPGFLDMLEELDRAGVVTSFSTNGTLLTEKVVSRLAKLERLESINVSIDSADPDEYRRIRGGDLEKVRRGLLNLIGANFDATRIVTSAVMMEMGRTGVRHLPEFLANVGVKNLVLQAVVDPQDTPAEMRLPSGAREIVEEIRQDGQRLGISVMAVDYLRERIEALEAPVSLGGWKSHPEALPGHEAGSLTKVCTAPWGHIAVDCYGRVFPCCNSPSWVNLVGPEDLVLGDLSTESLEDVWFGAKFRHFRERLITGDLPPVCRICPVVPEGVHPFTQFAAEVEWDDCRAEQFGIRVVVRNAGTVEWTERTGLLLAPSHPRGRDCAVRTAEWPSWNRAARMSEERVAPGEKATFDLRLGPRKTDRPEIFQLLVEGVCWLPNTEVAAVSFDRWHPAWAATPAPPLLVSMVDDGRNSTSPPDLPGQRLPPNEGSSAREGKPEFEAASLRTRLLGLEFELKLTRDVCARMEGEVSRLSGPGNPTVFERNVLRRSLADLEKYVADIHGSGPWRVIQWLRGLVGRRW